jgi:hypothetical protein
MLVRLPIHLSRMSAVALWGIPAAILGRIGFKLASEKALATAEVSVDL